MMQERITFCAIVVDDATHLWPSQALETSLWRRRWTLHKISSLSPRLLHTPENEDVHYHQSLACLHNYLGMFRWGKYLLIVNTRSQCRIFGANLCQSVPQHCCTFFFSAKRNKGPNSMAAFILASAVCNHTATLSHRPTPPKTAWLSRGFLLTHNNNYYGHVNTDLWPHKVYSTSASAWLIDGLARYGQQPAAVMLLIVSTTIRYTL